MIYELFYLVGENKSQNIDEIREAFKSFIKEQGGHLLEPEVQEKRKMAYKIKGQRRGIYIAQRFDLPESEDQGQKEDLIRNISRQIKLHPDVLRFILVKAEELPPLEKKEEEKNKENFLRKMESLKDKQVSREKKEDLGDKKEDKNSLDKKLEEILNI